MKNKLYQNGKCPICSGYEEGMILVTDKKNRTDYLVCPECVDYITNTDMIIKQVRAAVKYKKWIDKHGSMK